MQKALVLLLEMREADWAPFQDFWHLSHSSVTRVSQDIWHLSHSSVTRMGCKYIQDFWQDIFQLSLASHGCKRNRCEPW